MEEIAPTEESKRIFWSAVRESGKAIFVPGYQTASFMEAIWINKKVEEAIEEYDFVNPRAFRAVCVGRTLVSAGMDVIRLQIYCQYVAKPIMDFVEGLFR